MTLGFLWFRGPNEFTYAATGRGVLLITPYVLAYDLMGLAMSIAFLVSYGMKREFLPWEKTLLVCIGCARSDTYSCHGHRNSTWLDWHSVDFHLVGVSCDTKRFDLPRGAMNTSAMQ